MTAIRLRVQPARRSGLSTPLGGVALDVESAGLVMNRRGDLVQLVGVCARVVCAEEEVVSTGKLDAHVGLRSTTVTAVKGSELGAGCYGSRHVLPFFPEELRVRQNIQPARIIPSHAAPDDETLLRPYVARAA